jgi:hypothetical protein
MTGTTASASDSDPFFDNPEAYATPIWEVKTISSPQASKRVEFNGYQHEFQ